jgi:hypothetical protein
MFKIERLADVHEARRLTHLRKPGNVSIKIAKPTRRRAKAERIAILARTDWQNRDAIVRVR